MGGGSAKDFELNHPPNKFKVWRKLKFYNWNCSQKALFKFTKRFLDFSEYSIIFPRKPREPREI